MPLSPVSLDKAFTFTRASEGSTSIGDGSMLFAVADAPRYWFDPVISGRRMGILVEPSRTNIFLNSLDNSLWTRSGLTIEDGPGIKFLDKVSNVKLATCSNNAEWHQFRSGSFQATSGVTYTASYFAKAGTGSIFRVALDGTPFATSGGAVGVFDLATGKIVSVSNPAKASIEPWKDGWFRCTISAASAVTAAATSSGSIGAAAAASTETMYISGGQNEIGQGSSSLIRTQNAQGTRAADLIVSNTDVEKYLSHKESTVVASYYPGYTAASNDINVAFWARDKVQVTTNLIAIRRRESGISEIVVTGSSPSPDATARASTSTDLRVYARVAASRDDAGLNLSFNNGAVVKTPTALHPRPNQILLGSAGNGQYLCGVLAEIKIIPKRVSDELLRTI